MSSPNQIVVSQVNDVTTVEITTAGPQGATGPQGIQGPNGTATVSIGTTTTGNAGTDASVTNTGTGTAAVLNFTIPRGATGATGATGPQGATGAAGADGNDGATGPQGPQGIQGLTGATGPQGPAGNDGADGATGATGSQGPQGIQGPAGNDGSDGSDATVNATNVNNAGAVMNSDLDGKGELLVGDGSGDPTALSVGTNGYVLKANSSTATGLEWSAAGSGGDVNQNAFSNVAVSGQDTVAADSATDTLNIAAGSNVTITTNASNDTVTIASTDTNTTYSVGDGGLTQNNFTDTLKTKLDGIAASANNYSISSDLLDEDNMASNSATKVPSQQSVKAYVDANSSDTTYSAGTGLSLSGTTFNVDQIALTTVQTAANESAQLALTTQEGDIVVRSDQNKSYVRNSGTAGTMADFTELLTPTDQVLSVNGNTGAISAAQIAAAVEAASDSNTFTDADHTKLNSVESGATADQTGSEIKSLYEGESDTNAFTDAEKTKLSGIEANATADQTDAEIRAAVEAATDSNVFTDADHTKLNGIETSADVTDATNVASAGAVMDGDFTSNGFMKRTGAGSYTVDTNTYLTSVPSGYLQNLSEDSSPQLGGDLDMNSNSISSGVLGIKNTGSQSEVRLYCEANNAHYVAIKAPPHAQFSGNHTFQLPPDGGTNNYVLKTDGSGNTSWVAQTAAYTNSSVDSHLNVSSASSGQILSWNGSDYAWVADQTGGGGGGGISNLVEDTTPQLGGNLDMQANNITGTGTITATSVASSANGMRKITTSTSSPSGGSDGDIWIKYTA